MKQNQKVPRLSFQFAMTPQRGPAQHIHKYMYDKSQEGKTTTKQEEKDLRVDGEGVEDVGLVRAVGAL